jgi:Uma2 family endonuclease
MATAAHLSLEEFHRLYDGAKPAYEYWFGEAIQKPMATNLHSALQLVLAILLRARGWFAFPEATLKLVPDAAPVPDVIASREALPQLYATKPVGICIEILSPDDRLKKAMEKSKHYLAWGVQHVWIINPYSRTAWMMTSEHPDGIWVHPDGNLVAGNTEIPLSEIFAEVDKMVV